MRSTRSTHRPRSKAHRSDRESAIAATAAYLSLPGLTRQSIFSERTYCEDDGCPCVFAFTLNSHFKQQLLFKDTVPRSRRAGARVLPELVALRNQRAQGMPGARSARSRAWCVVITRVSHRGHAENTRHSLRNGFNGFLRALPGDRACLSPSPVQSPAPT